ncbi:OmpA family protein [Telluribacter humicola]|uniref:OmpA family protein n=1 Tax=Telluribacter humicola TaxID=1720261 RepID=UPI001A9774C4|nr:OmpA family protein [Telluribacter humicola]
MKKLLGLTICILALIISACNNTGNRIEDADSVSEVATEDTAVAFQNDAVWANIDFDVPVIVEPDLQDTDITLRGTDTLSIYSLEQDIMFNTAKAQILPAGEEKLQKIADSIRKRIGDSKAMIRVYGFTDSRAGKEFNLELGKERAKAVEAWLSSQAGFDASRIQVISLGEKLPEATNETAAGRQQNRRVEIVVVKS